MKFSTDFEFQDRESKARYVWLKYHPLLKGRILDVGADRCHLKKHLPAGTVYTGIGIEGTPDVRVDLEEEGLPFRNDSFDCALCLDVLEHLENLHSTFDELCRVSRRYVIVSLPNPWANFYKALTRNPHRHYAQDMLKFYGLPLEPPGDRHRWFFSNEDAEKFIAYRAARNAMCIVQMDNDGIRHRRLSLKTLVRRLAETILFRNDFFNFKNVRAGTLWAVLERARP